MIKTVKDYDNHSGNIVDDKIPTLNVITRLLVKIVKIVKLLKVEKLLAGTEVRVKNDVKLNSMMQNNKS